MIANQLVHLEHVDGVLLEDLAHPIVADNLALVAGVLQVVGLDVLPELFDNLRSGQLDIKSQYCSFLSWIQARHLHARHPRDQPVES